MKHENWDRLLEKFDRYSPANAEAVRAFEAASGIELPADYRQFLELSNGGSGFIGDGIYVALWRVEELIELNKSYEIGEYCPGLLVFGSDGAGEAFAFDIRSSLKAVVAIPFVGMDESTIAPVASGFGSFMEGKSEYFVG